MLAVASVLLGGCDRQPTTNNSGMPVSSEALPGAKQYTAEQSIAEQFTAEQPTVEQWQRVAQLHILFAHQSVGGNLLDGIQMLASEQHIPLLISETRAPLAGPGIQHFKVGRNEDPEGKLADFRATFDRISANAATNTATNASAAANADSGPDVALLKFCFIDFMPSIDPKQLAQHYIATLDDLARAHPHTAFVAMTSPLTTVQSGPRAWLKKLLGKAPGGYASNAERHIFNQTLRAHYSANQLFDLAALESGNGRSGVDFQGQHIEALNPNLSDDGGHLNAAGQRLLGGALIAHIASVGKLPIAPSQRTSEQVPEQPPAQAPADQPAVNQTRADQK